VLRWSIVSLLVVTLGLAGYTGFRLLRSGLTTEIYRARLGALARDHEKLLEQYNQAIRKTAVTEIVVEDGRMQIAIRTSDGEIQLFDTPFDPREEIYVDYVVVDGRLWIRRVFDDATPPRSGLVIDPRFVDVDWDDDSALQGQAVYRSLETGRWVVTVTGDGAMGLARRPEHDRIELAPPPIVREFTPIDEEVSAVLDSIQPSEVIETMLHELDLQSRSASDRSAD
jgi:hypothetical protein